MTTRRNFLACIVAAVAMAPLLRFRMEPVAPELTQDFLDEMFETLTVSAGEWGNGFGFQWYRENLEGGKFPVGMGDTYTVTDADIGKLISVTITA